MKAFAYGWIFGALLGSAVSAPHRVSIYVALVLTLWLAYKHVTSRHE